MPGGDNPVNCSGVEKHPGNLSAEVLLCNQQRIEPPKAARGHATYIHCKMLYVTKHRI